MKAKGVFGKLQAKLASGNVAAPIDSLRGFAHTLLHEVSGLLVVSLDIANGHR